MLNTRRLRPSPIRVGLRTPVAPLLLAALFLLLPRAARAEIRLPAIIGDHMVLQQGSPTIWGWADPGKTITVEIAQHSATAVTGDDGRWTATLAGVAAGGPHTLTITGDGTARVADVLIGEVWLGSGQSNVLLPVRVASDGEPPHAADECRGLRFFTVERAASATPRRDVNGAWQVCSPETAAGFSAVGYFFGRRLEEMLHVPIGVIVSGWGSTSIDVWLPGAPAPQRDSTDDESASGVAFDLSFSELRLVAKDPARPALPIMLDDTGTGLGGAWKAFAKPGSRARIASERDAVAFERFSGNLADADAWASTSTQLAAGRRPVDMSEFAAVAFRARGEGEFRFFLGQPTIADGDDYASEIFHPGADWAPFQFAIDSLKQGGWGARRPFTRDAIATLGFTISAPPPHAPGSAFNAMIAPLAPLRLRGVLWYQGEADTGRAAEYGRLLGTLVDGWRAAWGAADLPFLVVQLPGYGPVLPEPGESRWAELREAQRTIVTRPATAVVTTIDLGDPSDIHPKRKAEVGKRLARAVARLAYGREDVAAGPVLADVVAQGGRVRLRFTTPGGGLADAGDVALRGFALSANGRGFQWANARILDATTVEVWSDAVPDPVEVRYAWADDPICSLTSREGLPAAPFRARIYGEGAGSADRPPTGRSRDGAAAPRAPDPPPAPPAH